MGRKTSADPGRALIASAVLSVLLAVPMAAVGTAAGKLNPRGKRAA